MKEKFPFKIAFVGTSCIGKTTLLEDLRMHYDQNQAIVFVEEAARLFFTQNPQITDRFSVDIQGKIQDLALQNERNAYQSRANIILCDRSVIDAVVYVRSQGDKEGAEKLLKRIEFWLPTYRKFILLNPADIPYQTDDVRQETEQTRHKFHEAFIEFFAGKKLPYELVSGNPQERLKRIKNILAQSL